MSFTDNWIPIKEYAQHLGTTLDSVYSKISRERKTQTDAEMRYKKVGKYSYVNIGYIEHVDRQNQQRYEDAYFSMLELLGSEYEIAKKIAMITGRKLHNVHMYLRQRFLVKYTIGDVRNLYIEAMEHYLKEVG